MSLERNTKQKTVVFDIVNKLDHPSAEQVYKLAFAKCPSISKATVYRILNGLVEQGRLRRFSFPDNADRYDITTKMHGHLICVDCGRVDDAVLKNGEEVECVDSKYKILSQTLVFTGVCPKCLAERNLQK